MNIQKITMQKSFWLIALCIAMLSSNMQAWQKQVAYKDSLKLVTSRAFALVGRHKTAAFVVGSVALLSAKYLLNPETRALVQESMRVQLAKFDDCVVIPLQAQWMFKQIAGQPGIMEEKLHSKFRYFVNEGNLRYAKMILACGSRIKNDFIEKAINGVDDEGFMALSDAAALGRIKIVEFLLRAGAQFDAKDKDGRTACQAAGVARRVMGAVDKNSHTEVIAMLEGVQQLHNAVVRADFEKVNKLIAEGVIVHARSGDEGQTLLSQAVNSYDIIKALLNAGADINAEQRLRKI